MVSSLMLLSSGLVSAADMTADEYQALIATFSPEMQQLINDRDTINIPKEQIFKEETVGITWEEFQQLPRRVPTDAEIKGLQQAAENRKQAGENPLSLGDMFGSPAGTNSFDYSIAYWGDILAVHDGTVPWGWYRHIGIFDKSRYDSGLDPILEADPVYGVHYASQAKFLHYDQQLGLKPLPGYGYMALGALIGARAYLGLPYNWTFYKWDVLTFYCSSLVWRGYYNQGWDIDYNGGNFVSPDDIVQSPYLVVWQSAW